MMEAITATRSRGYGTGRLLAQRFSNLTRLAVGSLFGADQSQDRLLSIEERIGIGAKKSLILVNCAGRRFLIATAGEAIAAMVEVRPPCEDGPAVSAPHRTEGRL